MTALFLALALGVLAVGLCGTMADPDDHDPIVCTCPEPVPADATRATGTPVGQGGPLVGECATCRRPILGRDT